MTGNAIAKNEALSVEQLDAVSGGMLWIPASVAVRVTEMAEAVRQQTRQGVHQNDPASIFQQVVQQLTQGQP